MTEPYNWKVVHCRYCKHVHRDDVRCADGVQRADHELLDMSPEAVGKRLAEGWLEGTDQNSVDELRTAVVHLARRLGSMAEIIYDDEAVGAIADGFRVAADTMEAEFGERLRRGVRHKMKRRAMCSLG